MATKKEMMITLGTPVKLVDATYGWGNAKLNDWGIVVSRTTDNKDYSIIIPRIDFLLTVARKDIEVAREALEDTNTEDFGSFIKATETEANKLVVSYLRNFRGARENLMVLAQSIANKVENNKQEAIELQAQLSSVRKVIDSKDRGYLELRDYTTLLDYTSHLLQNCYKEIKVIDSVVIVAHTKPIKLSWTHPQTGEIFMIDLGEYKVTVGYIGIRFEHTSDSQIRDKNKIHPHIKSDGKACWGTWWNGRMAPALAKMNYMLVLHEAYQFLSQYAPEGWYVPVMYWHPDVASYCKECWFKREQCKCNIRQCIYCGEEIRDGRRCKCKVCPESNEIIGITYDEFCVTHCEKWDKENEVCKSEVRG